MFELNQDITLLEQPEAEFEPHRTRQIIAIGSVHPVSIDALFNRVSNNAPTAAAAATAPSAVVDGGAGVGEDDDELCVPDFVEGGVEESALPPLLPESEDAVATVPQPGHLVVDGVELHENCALSTLRAACAALGLGKSGGKAAVLQRLRNHFAKQRLLEVHEAQDDPMARSQLPREQAPVHSPSAEEVRRHNLSHIPYQPWCEHCLKYPAKADRHIQRGPETRERSARSFDFCSTERPTCVRGERLICLILKDGHTGAIEAIPTPGKGGSSAYNFLVTEATKFLNYCGQTEITFKSDSEPAGLALQQGIKDLRSKMKLGTILEQTESGDHQANPAEQAVDQTRQLVGTLLSQFEEAAKISVDTMSPLHSWAWRHAAWLRMRYSRTGGASPFQITTGRPYNGNLVCFGEVVYGRLKSSVKGKPRWVKMLALGKLAVSDLQNGITASGMFITTRSVRRLPEPYDPEFYKVLRDMTWSQSGFLSGHLGQTRPQKSEISNQGDQPILDVQPESGPSLPMPYPGYTLADDAMLSELVPPAPLKPVQTTTGASAAMDVEPPVSTPLEPGPTAPSTAESSTPSGLVPSG